MLSAIPEFVHDDFRGRVMLIARAGDDLLDALRCWQTLLDVLPVPLWVKDQSGCYLYVNPACAEYLGTAVQQMLGKADAAILPTHLAECRLAADLACLQQACAEQMVWQNGEARLLLPVAGGSVLMAGICVDGDGAQVLRQALHHSESRFLALFEGATALAIQGYTEDGRVIYWNAASERLYGYSRNEAIGSSLYDLIIPQIMCEQVRQDVAQMFAERQGSPSARLMLRHCDGHLVPVFSSHAIVQDPGFGTVLFCMDIDLSPLVEAEQALQESECRYRALFEAAGDGILVIRNGVVEDCNRSACDIFRVGRRELLGSDLLMLSCPRQESDIASDVLLMDLMQARRSGYIRYEWRHKRPDGTIFDAEWVLSEVRLRDEHFFILSFRDITERKQTASLIWHQANFDNLTGLPNRYLFQDRLAQEILKSQRSGKQLALLMVDLDHFKEVNDTLGHAAGDLLLKEAADRLNDCVRDSDTLARLGGDEFAIIIVDFCDLKNISRVIEEILRRIAEPFSIYDQIAYVTASIGITVCPDDGVDAELLQKNADQSLYASKRLGRNRYSYFMPSMQQLAMSRVSLSNDLRDPETTSQFHLLFQPVIDLASGRLVKAEALLRWQHPTRGLVNPADFIPITEDTGLVVEIGNWVFREAVGKAKLWRERYRPDLQISINVSPVQFYSTSDCMKEWLSYLQQAELPGSGVALEITERLLLDASDQVTGLIRDFRMAGIEILLDDFGTGYSSLSYLKKFRIDYLKIDRSFVVDMDASRENSAVCDAIIVMAHKLGMRVVAEGVENNTQMNLLKQAGCDLAQGYLFSEPVTADEFERLLRELTD